MSLSIESLSPERAAALEAVIATSQLNLRICRKPDPMAENRALIGLAREMAKAPLDFFQKFVDTARSLSHADSTGISLLDQAKGRFIWPAVSGPLDSYIGEGTPSDFGPCGTVLDRNAPILFIHPERYFTYLEPITPPLEEVLLIPFHMDGKAVGTVWAVMHGKDRKFDAEDRRVLQDLSEFAASAYKVLSATGNLKPFLS